MSQLHRDNPVHPEFVAVRPHLARGVASAANQPVTGDLVVRSVEAAVDFLLLERSARVVGGCRQRQRQQGENGNRTYRSVNLQAQFRAALLNSVRVFRSRSALVRLELTWRTAAGSESLLTVAERPEIAASAVAARLRGARPRVASRCTVVGQAFRQSRFDSSRQPDRRRCHGTRPVAPDRQAVILGPVQPDVAVVPGPVPASSATDEDQRQRVSSHWT